MEERSPRILMSDNATNFTKSKKLLTEIRELKEVQDELNVRGVEWKFTPPICTMVWGYL